MDPCLLDSCSAKHVMFWLRKDFLKISDIIKTILFFNSIRHISYIKKKVLEEFSLAPERLQNWKAINLKCKQRLKASLSIIAEVCWAWYLEKIHLMWRKWEWFPASPQLLRCHWKFFIKKKKNNNLNTITILLPNLLDLSHTNGKSHFWDWIFILSWRSISSSCFIKVTYAVWLHVLRKEIFPSSTINSSLSTCLWIVVSPLHAHILSVFGF